ncbi:MAG: serine O-acetyltransferase [Phormidesmis sp.]
MFSNLKRVFAHRLRRLVFLVANRQQAVNQQVVNQQFPNQQPWPIVTDFEIIFKRDPAARHWLEVLCCYPGLHAIAFHRLAHWLHHRHIIFLPRLLSHLARGLTGIEIHPAAQLGKGVFIDHGMGVVIGETAIVGDYTLIYQGVTLGGTGKETGKRHPTVSSRVVIGAGAKVLGNIRIGHGARIGAGAVVLRNVPAHCTAVGIPSQNVCECNTLRTPLEHGQLPDAEAATLKQLLARVEVLEEQLNSFQSYSF